MLKWMIRDGCCIDDSPLRGEILLDQSTDSLRAFFFAGRTPHFVVGPLGDAALHAECTFFRIPHHEGHTPSAASAPSGVAGHRGISNIGEKGRGEVRMVDRTRGSTSFSCSFRTMYWLVCRRFRRALSKAYGRSP